jgi:lipopolysaccharide/colanic/teichoic acid biosynthesis glycosyltransferase/glycosyltransferase involved in cell wall biosynthesis
MVGQFVHLGRTQAMMAATPSTRRRICLVVASEMTVRTFLVPQLRALQDRYRVTVVANTANRRLLDELGIRADLVCVGIERWISPWRDLVAFGALVRTLGAGRFDLVHSMTPKAGLLAMAAAKMTRVPVRVHTFTGQVWATRRGVGRTALRLLDTLLARLATVTLADSLSQRDFLVREGVAPASGIVVLGKGSVNGVDPAVFTPAAALRREVRERLQLAASEVLVLFVGRLNRDKGVLDLARAFALVAPTCPALRLLIVGPDEEGLQPAIATACGPHIAHVDFLPFTDRPQELMAAADIFCLPSYREGLGAVILEAAACAVPVIASRIYGITDAVIEGTTALLHAPGDVQELAGLLGRTAVDPELRRSLGDAGRDYVVREFHVDHLIALQLALYARLLHAPHEAPPSVAPVADARVPPIQTPAGWYSRRGKRTIDILVAAVALVALAPLFAVMALLVRTTLGSPVLFRQRRPGLNGAPFTLLKFRTMTDRYDEGGTLLADADRLTMLGRFLRATSLDELPQLWNVLTGDMSLVGPRPLLTEYLGRYSARQAQRHAVKPGVTGLAQVNGRNELPWPQRLELDVAYAETVSAAMDARILARTVWHVLARRGITQAGHATMGEFRGAEGQCKS